MESSNSNAVNLTFNGTLNGTTNSTSADMPRDGLSSERRDAFIQSLIQGVQVTHQELGHSHSASVEGTAAFLSNQDNVNHCSHGEFCLFCQAIGSSNSSSLLENTHALNSADTGSRERMADVVNPHTQAIIPENEGVLVDYVLDEMTLPAASMSFDEENEDVWSDYVREGLTPPSASLVFAEENEGELVDELLAGLDLSGPNTDFQALTDLHEYLRGGCKTRSPFFNVDLHKYEGTDSTSLESKEHCSICLDEYSDGEEIAKTHCGHLYHIGCISEWNKHASTCPICKRKVSVVSYAILKIHSFYALVRATNLPVFDRAQ